MNLRVMQYNIFSGRNLAGEQDIRFSAGAIAACRPDIVSLNEVRSHTSDVGAVNQAQQLGETLGMKWFFGRSIDVNGGEYGNALLTRWPILASEVIHIPDCPTEGAKRFEHRTISKNVIEVEERRITVLVSHWGLSRNEQISAAQTTLDLLKTCEAPILLLGDFNVRPGDPILAPLYEELTDTAGGSETLRTYPSGTPTEKIDYIFISPDVICQHLDSPDTQMSDHRPLLAEVWLR